MQDYPKIQISEKGTRELKNRFPWIYDTEVTASGEIPDGSVCYIIGVLKTIRKQLDKHDGDLIHVLIEPFKEQEIPER